MSARIGRLAVAALPMALGCTSPSGEPTTTTEADTQAMGSTGQSSTEDTGSPTTDSSGPSMGTTETDTGAGTFMQPEPDPAFCPPGVEPSLELGHGDVSFRPIDEDIAQLVHGHQGGYHVVIGMRGQGFDLADWGNGHLRATIDGEVVADHGTIVVMECAKDGQYSEALWINLIFDINADGLMGRVAVVDAEFSDYTGQTVAVTEEITISKSIQRL